MEFLSETLAGFTAMSHWEYIAVGLAVAYLLLAIKQSLWCWAAAFTSTFIYTLLFWNGLLYMESFLNFYYMGMAVFGWLSWRAMYNKKIATHQDSHTELSDNELGETIIAFSLNTHVHIIIICCLLSGVLGYVMDNYTSADFAYLDTATTIFSVMATYLVVKKEINNWLYWVVIDAVSIYIYTMKGYYPTAILFILYTVLAIVGYQRWRKMYKASEATWEAQAA
ncbi:nicotinamide riboside transporter PnuC [Flocculibacter collagenilyticus]|uniref:nicotinamide riboside transporter PnuC n=1 Tax=Flocculibacter collagenilyticus TaxID=2744479 RepID=UPI0018F3AF6A|nr:nicotinamide riboside transporter PnuC [Flocculibacter collagenilyticus]